MPKTKDAFALRGFDETRILQRPYFRSYFHGIRENCDEDMLADYDFTAISHLSSGAIIANLVGLRKIKAAVAGYTKKILAHESRLERFNLSGDEQQEFRAWKLQQEYLRISQYLLKFQSDINQYLREGEQALNLARRREFSTRLRTARKAAGYRQIDVSVKLSCSLNKYASYEQAATEPSIPMLIRLCEMFRCDANQLLGI